MLKNQEIQLYIMYISDLQDIKKKYREMIPIIKKLIYCK